MQSAFAHNHLTPPMIFKLEMFCQLSLGHSPSFAHSSLTPSSEKAPIVNMKFSHFTKNIHSFCWTPTLRAPIKRLWICVCHSFIISLRSNNRFSVPFLLFGFQSQFEFVCSCDNLIIIAPWLDKTLFSSFFSSQKWSSVVRKHSQIKIAKYLIVNNYA